MLRQFFIYLSRQQWAYRAMLGNPLTRAMAWRFVAGEDLATAIGIVRDLNARGIQVTLDHLGENVTSKQEAVRAADEALYRSKHAGRDRTTMSEGIPPEAQVDALLRRAVSQRLGRPTAAETPDSDPVAPTPRGSDA